MQSRRWEVSWEQGPGDEAEPAVLGNSERGSSAYSINDLKFQSPRQSSVSEDPYKHRGRLCDLFPNLRSISQAGRQSEKTAVCAAQMLLNTRPSL